MTGRPSPGCADGAGQLQRIALTHPGEISFTVDAAEHARRLAAGVSGPRGLGVLDALLNLPVGHPVQLDAVGPEVLARLRALPAGAVAFDGTTVTRLLAVPVHPRLAITHGRRWGALHLVRATRFAPYCSRAVVLALQRAPDEQRLAEADFYGVGVGLRRVPDAEVHWLLEPAPYRPLRGFNAVRWQFAEELYAAWRRPATPAPGDPAAYRSRRRTLHPIPQEDS